MQPENVRDLSNELHDPNTELDNGYTNPTCALCARVHTRVIAYIAVPI